MLTAAQPAPPPIAPPRTVADVPGGDLATGLAGWSAVGPSMLLVGGPIIEAADNTSVVSPSFPVPPSGQDVRVVMGVPGANAVVQVSARPLDGGADIPLATIVPDRAVREWSVGVGPVRGRTVRLVIDPVTSLGRRLYVRSVGPVREVLPNWEVVRGVPVVGVAWGRRGIVVDDDVLDARTPVVTVPAGTRFLGVMVRGTGSVRARVGGRSVRVTASPRVWSALRVPVGPGAQALMSLRVTPTAGSRLMVADVATPLRQMRITGVSVAVAGSRSVVRATVRPDAAGMAAQVRVGQQVVGRGTVRPDGTLVIRATGAGGARLVLVDDASRIGTSTPITLG